MDRPPRRRAGAHVRRRRALPLLQRRRRRQRRPAGHHEGVPARRQRGGRQPEPAARSTRSRCPSSSTARARLAKMDEQDVEACLMLPTTGVGVEPQLRETPEVLYPSLRAFNRWLEEDWGYGGDGRIYGAPLLSLFDLDAGARRARAPAGARRALRRSLTAGPVAGRSPGRSVLRSVLGALRGGRHQRRLPHRPHALQRDVQRAVGPAAASAVAPPLADGVRAVVHRAADRRHAHRADRRQPLRPLPAPEGAERRVRLDAGSRRCCASSTTSRGCSARTCGASARRR